METTGDFGQPVDPTDRTFHSARLDGVTVTQTLARRTADPALDACVRGYSAMSAVFAAGCGLNPGQVRLGCVVMSGNQAGVGLRYLGGPSALLEVGGLRLLTDPTFDPPGDYPVGDRVLRKTVGALVTPDQVGRVDAVLLSHDQHPDNLDGQGRGYLGSVPLVLSTAAAQQRLGRHGPGAGELAAR